MLVYDEVCFDVSWGNELYSTVQTCGDGRETNQNTNLLKLTFLDFNTVDRPWELAFAV
jgi:hypothetical protein